MEINTAYQVANLVTQHLRIGKQLQEWRKVYDIENLKGRDDLRGLEITFDLEPDNQNKDAESFEFEGQHEVDDFLLFLVEIVHKRQRDIEFQLDKILPESLVKSLSIIRVQYQDYLKNIAAGTGKELEQVKLVDLHISQKELQAADEVWLVHGDYSCRLKPLGFVAHNPVTENAAYSEKPDVDSVKILYANYLSQPELLRNQVKNFDDVTLEDVSRFPEVHTARQVWLVGSSSNKVKKLKG